MYHYYIAYAVRNSLRSDEAIVQSPITSLEDVYAIRWQLAETLGVPDVVIINWILLSTPDNS